MAKVVGRQSDVDHYTGRLALLKAKYHELYFDAAAGKYSEAGTAAHIQSHQVFPLYLGLVPVAEQPKVVAALVAAVHNQSEHVNCGIIGSRFLLETLTRFGHADLALTVATNPTCPGWGYMVEQRPDGANKSHDTPGTMWETWQDVHGGGVSKNHPALGGGVGVWLYQLAGKTLPLSCFHSVRVLKRWCLCLVFPLHS